MLAIYIIGAIGFPILFLLFVYGGIRLLSHAWDVEWKSRSEAIWGNKKGNHK